MVNPKSVSKSSVSRQGKIFNTSKSDALFQWGQKNATYNFLQVLLVCIKQLALKLNADGHFKTGNLQQI